MKKFTMFLSVFMLACLLITAPALAGYANQGTSGVAGANYDANGWPWSTGDADASVGGGIGSDFSGFHSAGAFSGKKVESEAWGVGGFIPLPPFQSANAFGEAHQWSEAGVDLHNGNWANGGQGSRAGYKAVDTGLFLATANGEAETIGGTFVNAFSHNTWNSSIGMSGAVTGSFGSANANYSDQSTWTSGSGGVNHASYASKRGAQAWTSGSANYSYQTNGQNYTSGGGFAGTFGVSKVVYNPYTGHLTATAKSSSFSSGGSTNASGGVHIVN